MYAVSYLWLGILSDLFINLVAGWFGFVFIELSINTRFTIPNLIFKILLGILSLLVAKQLRQTLINYE